MNYIYEVYTQEAKDKMVNDFYALYENKCIRCLLQYVVMTDIKFNLISGVEVNAKICHMCLPSLEEFKKTIRN